MDIIINLDNNEIKNIIIEDENKKVNKSKINFNNFLNKNKDKIKEKIICPLCFGSYTYFNKSVHIRTKRHLRMEENKQNNKTIINI